MAVTMKNIAERAGVTRSAVSAVLNGTSASRVSDEKRRLILEISRELNYRRNFAATALKTRKTGLLGFMCGGLQSPYFSELTMAMTREAEGRGYKMMLTVMQWESELDLKYLDRMLTGMCDGMFMSRELKQETEQVQERIKASSIPFVMLGSELDSVSSVSFDYAGGMTRAFEELRSNGHRCIAFAGHYGDVNKLDAYRGCCRCFGIEPVEYIIQFDSELAGAAECGSQIAGSLDRVTALITTDYSLSLLMPSLDKAGVKIPDNLSVVAFNNTLQSRLFRPPLTSVGMDPGLLARYGMDIMQDMLEQPDSAKIRGVLLQPELIRRASVKVLEP